MWDFSREDAKGRREEGGDRRESMIFGRIVELVGSVGLFSRKQEVEGSDSACRVDVETG